jgi:hypothetical protein
MFLTETTQIPVGEVVGKNEDDVGFPGGFGLFCGRSERNAQGCKN